MGLAIALSLTSVKPIIAHVVHDIRSPQDCGADAEFVRQLAARLGCPYECRSALVKEMGGNLEANARAARYRVLESVAQDNGCLYIATGHHADDQGETVLMHLLRGAGVRGIGGIPDRRSLGSVTLVRPMLGIRRSEIEQLCRDARIRWRHDSTNDDLSLHRNRIRRELIPLIEQFRHDGVERLVDSAANARDAHDALELLVDQEYTQWEVVSGALQRGRRDGRAIPRAVFDGVLRRFIRESHAGVGLDRVSRRAVGAVFDAVVADSTDPTVHRVGPLVVRVDAHTIRIGVAD